MLKFRLVCFIHIFFLQNLLVIGTYSKNLGNVFKKIPYLFYSLDFFFVLRHFLVGSGSGRFDRIRQKCSDPSGSATLGTRTFRSRSSIKVGLRCEKKDKESFKNLARYWYGIGPLSLIQSTPCYRRYLLDTDFCKISGRI